MDNFLKQWKDDVVESLCKYDAETIDELVRNVTKKARADAIESLIEYLDLECSQYFDNDYSSSNR